MSTSDTRLYVGLGHETKASRVAIEWPGGKKQEMENVPANQVLVLEER